MILAVEATPEPEDYEDEQEEEEEEVTDDGVAATKEPGHAPSSHPESYQSSQADVQTTHWSHHSIAQDAVMAPATSHPANRNLATGMNAQQLTGGYPDGAYPNAAANYLANNAAYASRPRPLQEIVSSMQGNYNFLQESQIELESESFDSSSFVKIFELLKQNFSTWVWLLP